MIVHKIESEGSRGSPDTARRSKVTGITIKPPQLKGILLPEENLSAAEEMVKRQYSEQRGGDERLNRQIDLVVSEGVVKGFTPEHEPAPGRPGFVILYPNKPGVKMEDIAETFGGEIGLVSSEVRIDMAPVVDLEMALTRITQVQRNSMDWIRVDGEKAAQHFLPGSDFAVPDPLLLTRGEGAVSVSMRILGIDRKAKGRKVGTIYGAGVRFGVGQATFEGYNDPLPVFGAEKQAMLKLTRDITAAFGSKVGTPL